LDALSTPFKILNPEVIEIPLGDVFPKDTGLGTTNIQVPSANRLFLCAGTVFFDLGGFMTTEHLGRYTLTLEFPVPRNDGTDLDFSGQIFPSILVEDTAALATQRFGD
jgi:hypothetical protein